MSELNDPFADQVSETEREMLGLSQSVMVRYRCSRCQHEDAVPDVVSGGGVAAGRTKPADATTGCRPAGLFRALGHGHPCAARSLFVDTAVTSRWIAVQRHKVLLANFV
jgi:hypothetical protein